MAINVTMPTFSDAKAAWDRTRGVTGDISEDSGLAEKQASGSLGTTQGDIKAANTIAEEREKIMPIPTVSQPKEDVTPISESTDPKLAEKLQPTSFSASLDPSVATLATSLAARQAVPTAATPTMTATTIDRGGVSNVMPTAINAATIATAPQAQFRTQQQTLAKQLADQAAGIGGPTAAQMQLKQATDRNLAQQLAMQAGASGSQAALARRQAVSQQAITGQEAAQQSAILRAQEQQGAQQQLAGITEAGRGADIGLATGQAGLEQQTNVQNAENSLRADLANQGVDLEVLKTNAAAGNVEAQANLNAALTKMGMDQDMIKTYMAAEQNLAQMKQEATLQAQALNAKADSEYKAGLISLEELNTKKQIANQQAEAAVTAAKTESNAQQNAAMAGAAATIAAAGIAYSDVNLKENIKPSLAEALAGSKKPDRLDDFLNKLSVFDYDYKDQKFGKGKHTSVMAQDLEKSEIGKKGVIETPEGKMVNYAKYLPEMLAANVKNHKEQLGMAKRLSALEEALLSKQADKLKGK